MFLGLRRMLRFYCCTFCLVGFNIPSVKAAYSLKSVIETNAFIVSFDSFKFLPFKMFLWNKQEYHLAKSFLSFSKPIRVSGNLILLELVFNENSKSLEQADVLEEIGVVAIDKIGCRRFENNILFLWEGQRRYGYSFRGYSKSQFLVERRRVITVSVTSRGFYRIRLMGEKDGVSFICAEDFVLVL